MAEKQLILIICIQSTIINLAETSFLAALQGKARQVKQPLFWHRGVGGKTCFRCLMLGGDLYFQVSADLVADLLDSGACLLYTSDAADE